MPAPLFKHITPVTQTSLNNWPRVVMRPHPRWKSNPELLITNNYNGSSQWKLCKSNKKQPADMQWNASLLVLRLCCSTNRWQQQSRNYTALSTLHTSITPTLHRNWFFPISFSLFTSTITELYKYGKISIICSVSLAKFNHPFSHSTYTLELCATNRLVD